MAQTDDVWFIPHCDEPSCSLGRVNYTCPACGRDGDDYGELWSDHEEIYDGAQLTFACEQCKAGLVLKKGDDGFAVVVTKS